MKKRKINAFYFGTAITLKCSYFLLNIIFFRVKEEVSDKLIADLTVFQPSFSALLQTYSREPFPGLPFRFGVFCCAGRRFITDVAAAGGGGMHASEK